MKYCSIKERPRHCADTSQNIKWIGQQKEDGADWRTAHFLMQRSRKDAK